MTLSLIYAAGEQYRLATDSSRPFGHLIEPFSARSNHRDDVKFISTQPETQCRISLSKITESSATCELSPS
jgi:hypothetical protein